MADATPTYAFEDDGVYAVLNGEVIAKGADVAEAEENASDFLKKKEDKDEKESARKKIEGATHIVTPGGIKGKIQNRYASWDSDESITVRFDNGRIVSLATHKIPLDQFVTEELEKTAATDTPIGKLAARLDDTYGHDKDSLRTRIGELTEVANEARELLTVGASYTDEAELDRIVVHAEAELSEVRQALDHLEQTDAEIAPFDPQVVEQATIGVRDDGDWLGETVNQMVQEAEGQDFERMLDDGPTEYVAELGDAAVADAGVVQNGARDLVSAKTAGLEGEEVDKFRALFVERAEEARKIELASRKETAKKEASVEEPAATDGPDEALFF